MNERLFRAYFIAQWNIITKQLRESGVDLSKIPITSKGGGPVYDAS